MTSSTPHDIRLELAFEARVTVGTPFEVGDTPRGRRRVIPITGGTFEGPRIRGRVLEGGSDWQFVRPDGLAELEARYVLEADDGTLITVFNRALRHGPEDVMTRMAAGEPVEPGSYYFRTSFIFDAPEGPHDWLNRSIFIGAAERHPDCVVIRALAVH